MSRRIACPACGRADPQWISPETLLDLVAGNAVAGRMMDNGALPVLAGCVIFWMTNDDWERYQGLVRSNKEYITKLGAECSMEVCAA